MSISTPSIVPQSDDQNVYLVIDDIGQLGRDPRHCIRPV
jgi:hypothetical protein